MTMKQNPNKVEFIITNSDDVPSYLANTGSLIMMTDENGSIPDYERSREDHKKSFSYLYFKDSLIAGGIGFSSFSELDAATYLLNSYEDTFNDIYSKIEATYTYLSYIETYTDASPITQDAIDNLNW